ncbi:MAG: hypothetical protein A2Y10_09250 [Planctomycetes bacterium GWF2_41_51]|nr:MAG: hypothetical protein A2Y10_09250 [Planctomycetes bacterium GWF2_41_51]HBG27856.1 hypothetical protein [Phycisphaerales bacterium]
MKKLTIILNLLFCGCLFAEVNSVAVTVYNSNFGVVKEQRQMTFDEGLNTIRFTDVASSIDPTSVSFECLSSPGKISILEQNYEYDLVGTSSLLQRYIDKDVTISIKGSGADKGQTIVGTLLASKDNNLIIKDHEGNIKIISESSIENISLKHLPDDLVTKPTLVWLAQSEISGNENCQVAYTTNDISWKADYSAILNENENGFDFSGWVTIDNKSGTAYRDAKIKLVAGDVRRIVEQPQPMMEYQMMYKARAADAAGFEEKPFMEYHLYTLGRKSTINNNQTKQIEFITPAQNVPANKIYLYERQKNSEKIQVKFEFENKQQYGLGIALPKGKVRVFKRDTDESLEFVGEDEIDHTPKNEKLALYIGDAFDIAVEYKLIESRVERRSRWEKHSIELRNRKDSDVLIFVDEKFPAWVNWKIEEATHSYLKKDAATARFTVEVPADKVVTLEYSVNQKW